jgi:hypothetical protein
MDRFFLWHELKRTTKIREISSGLMHFGHIRHYAREAVTQGMNHGETGMQLRFDISTYTPCFQEEPILGLNNILSSNPWLFVSVG